MIGEVIFERRAGGFFFLEGFDVAGYTKQNISGDSHTRARCTNCHQQYWNSAAVL